MNTLVIDTSSNKKIVVELEIDGKRFVKKQKIGANRAQVVLPLFVALLKKHRLSFQDINNIEVATGPGSFTGLRVGIAVANTLSFALRIPVNGQHKIVEPQY